MTGVLKGKVAVVTGGNSGIGAAIARRFAADGARVFITGRDKAKLDAVVEKAGPEVTGVRVDVAVAADVDRLHEVVGEQAGRVDVLVANAGGGLPGTLGDITEESIDYTFGTNVKGVIFTVQKALSLLSDGASIVVTGSSAGVRPSAPLEVYGASKAAVRNLVRSWAQHAAERKFRINVLSPGPIETPGSVGALGPAFAELAGSVPLGRVGQPDEIASVAAFLASDASSFVNGAEWFVDGGQAQI